MTEQEAIKNLKDFKYLEYSNGIAFSNSAKEELDKAFDIAISALEQKMKLKEAGFTEEVIHNCKIFEDECIRLGMSFKDILEARDRQINGGWIPCSERLPDEHKSVFAKFKDTNKWTNAMFEKTSDRVNVTMELEDGKRIVREMSTCDGEWRNDIFTKHTVVAWKPLPEPYKAN